MSNSLCETSSLTPEVVLKEQLDIKSTNLNEVMAIFKLLADETRLNIVYILTKYEKLCVCDVSALVNCSIATASHHLRTLKNKGLAKSTKIGKQVLYSIDDEHVKQLIDIAIIHQQEVSTRGKK